MDKKQGPLWLAGPGDRLCCVCEQRRGDGLWFTRDGCGWAGRDTRPWSGAPFVCLDCAMYSREISWAEETVAWSPDYDDVRCIEPRLSRILRKCSDGWGMGTV